MATPSCSRFVHVEEKQPNAKLDLTGLISHKAEVNVW
jgi:hypothetical protein